MKIVDKTNETWKIGDIMVDNDERKGIIKKIKDDGFVIIRIGKKHVGDYFSGLAYEAGINMYCLQRKASESYRVNNSSGSEEWRAGDVLKHKGNDDIGLIVENDTYEYCLINITTDFMFINRYGDTADLQKDNREY